MQEKHYFIEQSYHRAKAIIHNIPNEMAHDIYALSFWLTNENDDERFAMLIFGL